MVYEYEDKLLDYASGSKTYEEYKAMSQELQEVYCKAKAFDEIVNLPDTYGYAEDYAEDVDIIINEYKERADDER